MITLTYSPQAFIAYIYACYFPPPFVDFYDSGAVIDEHPEVSIEDFE